MAVRRGGGSAWTVFAGLDGREYKQELRELGVETREFARGSKDEMDGLTGAVIAGTAALVAFGVQGVQALKDFQAEMLQVQYLYRDMDRAGRQWLESQARSISGIAGIGELQASQLFFRLGSTGTERQDLLREGLPIARAAAALQTDPGGLALAAGQGANLAGMSRTDYLNLLISTAQVSTSDIEGLRALAPRVLAGGNVAGLAGEDTLGLLAFATQAAGSPEEASTGLAALFAEAVKSDSKFGKEFTRTFGQSFSDAIAGRGATGFIAELERAYREWGEQEFFSAFGRRAGLIAVPLAAQSGFAGQVVGQVQAGQAGALESVLEKWEQELPHQFNLLRENINELRLSIGDGAADGVRGTLATLNELLADKDLQDALRNMGSMLGDLTVVMGELTVTTAALMAPLLKIANMELPGGSVLELAGYGIGISALGRAGRGGKNILTRLGALGGKGAAGGMLSGAGAGLGRVAAMGGRALPIAGQVLLANELLEVGTGFDFLQRSTDALRETMELAGEKIQDIDWMPGEHGRRVVDGFVDRKLARFEGQLDYWEDSAIVRRLGLDRGDIQDIYDVWYPESRHGTRGVGVYAHHAPEIGLYLETLEADLHLFSVAVQDTSQTIADAGDSIVRWTQEAERQRTQQQQIYGDGLLADARANYDQLFYRLSKGGLTAAENEQLARQAAAIARLADLTSGVEENTRQTAQNTQPQRDYRVYIPQIRLADNLVQ